MVEDRNTYEAAYRALIVEGQQIREQKSALLTEVNSLTEKEAKITKAIDALRVLIDSGTLIATSKTIEYPTRVSKWRASSLKFLQGSPGHKFTTAQILEFIHPNSSGLSRPDRRKATINLSAALGKLVDDGEILEDRSTDARGYLYYFEGAPHADTEISIATLILENPT